MDFSSEIKTLVHKLGATLSSDKGSIVTFVAARSGEGTSTVAKSFSQAVATEAGKKVLLIGVNAPTATNKQPGIIETLTAGNDLASALTPLEQGVHYIEWSTQAQNQGMSGKVVQDPAFWQTLLKTFDVVVIDAPALQTSSDTITFARLATATVLVVEAESTRKPVVENLRDTLTTAGAKIAGIVLNKRRMYIPEKIYKRL